MEQLVVEGDLPDRLRGRFLQSVPHPAHGTDPVSITGVHLADGTARWHRSRTHTSLLGPVPALAPAVRDGTRFARPALDLATGAWHTIATTPGTPIAEHVTVTAEGTVRRGRCFVLNGPTRIDTVAVTRDHLVVFDLSLVHDRATELIGLRAPYAWRTEKQARIGLLPLNSRSTTPRWFPIPPCFVPYAPNAFDDGPFVVIDALRQISLSASAHLIRWTLDLSEGSVDEELLCPADTAVVGKQRRHVYGTLGSTVFRHSGTSYDCGSGWRLSQPAIADEWLIVHGRRGATSQLMVFDAADLTAGPRSVVRLPVTVPVTARTAWER